MACISEIIKKLKVTNNEIYCVFRTVYTFRFYSSSKTGINSATFKPKIVGGRSPFSFPSLPLPLSLLSPSPSPFRPPFPAPLSSSPLPYRPILPVDPSPSFPTP